MENEHSQELLVSENYSVFENRSLSEINIFVVKDCEQRVGQFFLNLMQVS